MIDYNLIDHDGVGIYVELENNSIKIKRSDVLGFSPEKHKISLSLSDFIEALLDGKYKNKSDYER